MEQEKIAIIKSRLISLGVKKIGLMATELKLITNIISDNELIEGVVYGAYPGGLGWLIATDQRILFIDRKPFFSSTDEISYDVVSGIKNTHAGIFSRVTLHTKMGDFSIKYSNMIAATIFIKYIENRHLKTQETINRPVDKKIVVFNDSEISFLKTHDAGVLSTSSENGTVSGAVVYYLIDQYNKLYIVTKSSTTKAKNILNHSFLAFTIFDENKLQSLQIEGLGSIINDPKIRAVILARILQPRSISGSQKLPPITKIKDGDYLILRINPSRSIFLDYSK